MKKLLLITSVLFITLTAQASISIISDLDDTIKITNADDLSEAVYNGLFTTDAYTGMPQFLYSARSYSNSLYVISASPKLVRSNIEALFRKHAIKVDGMNLRESLADSDKVKFKVDAIKAIMEKNSDDFIFIGDDVEKDSVVYEEVKKLYPNRVLAIYIHSVKNRKIEKSSIRYWTSFDLAVHEAMANRMDPKLVPEFAKLLVSKGFEQVIPHFADCPKDLKPWEWQARTKFTKEAYELASRLVRYCKIRRSDLTATTAQ